MDQEKREEILLTSGHHGCRLFSVPSTWNEGFLGVVLRPTLASFHICTNHQQLRGFCSSFKVHVPLSQEPQRPPRAADNQNRA